LCVSGEALRTHTETCVDELCISGTYPDTDSTEDFGTYNICEGE